jgi:hypothetical protein
MAVGELRGLSSAGRAVALQASGRRFDPGRLHHFVGNVGKQVSGMSSPITGSQASDLLKNREKGICLDPRKREPIGRRCNRAGAGFFSE